MIKAFYSYSSILSQREYVDILKSYYRYNKNILLSLYDIKYYLNNEKDLLQDIFNCMNSIFLDSGRYEINASLRLGLSSKKWDYSLYLDTLKWVLSEFNLNNKLYIGNYDDYSLNLNDQIGASINTFNEIKNDFKTKQVRYVFTIHPKSFKVDDWDSPVIQNLASNFKGSSLIAIPEKELGASISDKIKNIKILTSYDYPLHLLGCLDPTYLIIFVLTGVRYFDGLNWLKFYFNDKVSYYRNLYELDLNMGKALDSRSYIVNNCIYIDKLINDLEYSINTGDYTIFEEEQRILSKICLNKEV